MSTSSRGSRLCEKSTLKKVAEYNICCSCVILQVRPSARAPEIAFNQGWRLVCGGRCLASKCNLIQCYQTISKIFKFLVEYGKPTLTFPYFS